MKKAFFFLLPIFVIGSCSKGPEKLPAFSPQAVGKIIEQMTAVMVHDVTNPPLAARFFSYTCLSGYEVMAQHDSAYPSMHGVLNGYPRFGKPSVNGPYSPQLSALLAMLATARKIQPSGKLLEQYEAQFLDSCRSAGFSEEAITGSAAYAQAISQQVLAYAKADGYNKISSLPRYTPLGQEGTWYPTPPGFFAPVEPHFNTVRSFTLDSCTQFKPVPPVAFSADKHSSFYALMLQNYGDTLTEERKEIAAFWDCNPFALEDNGHLLVGRKKISPGAHWMGITSIACQQANVSFPEAMKIHTVVALGLMDGFICCWDEKFRSNRIRPETAIRKYLDPTWKPFLQTPPFPEYLSGHSTISSASAAILTHYFGDNFSYTDTVEEPYGLKARHFSSFQEAAIEAGLSRFYGGIHFMDAITHGRKQGLQVGGWIIQKIEKRTDRLVLGAK